MKFLCQAVRTVTVEVLGVLIVVWMLSGLASWGLRAVAQTPPAWNEPWAGTVAPWQSSATEAIPPRPLALAVLEPKRPHSGLRKVGMGKAAMGLLRSTVAINLLRDRL